MKKNKKGFSYAEAMVTMLIVSIIMVATTPILTKRMNTRRGEIFQWANSGTSANAFFGMGPTQHLGIGRNSFEGEDADSKLIIAQVTPKSAGIKPQQIIRFYNDKKYIGHLGISGVSDDTSTTVGSLSLGYNALGSATLDQENIALGSNTLAAWNAGTGRNTAIGGNALQSADKASNNTAVGYGALYALRNEDSNSGNVAIGTNACGNLKAGSNNICIGSTGEDITGSSPSGALSIGTWMTGSGTDTKILTIHATVDADALMIQGESVQEMIAKASKGAYSYSSSGSVSTSSESGSIYSDSRLKNITSDFTGGLEEVNKLQVKNFTYKSDKDKKTQVGVIAQDLQKIFPNAVTKSKDGYLMIRKDEMFYAMVNAVKALSNKFNLQAKEIQKLQKQNSELSAKVSDLEARLKKLEQNKK